MIESEPSRLLARLKAEAAATPVPEAMPERLPPSEITLLPELFQPRGMADSHIHTLTGVAKSGRVFEAVEVIQVGQTVYLVDGHHRMEAYARAEVTQPIPVAYFNGTIEEAVLEAGRANSRAKLPMANHERQNYAWRLVKMGRYRGTQIVNASSVSLRQVAYMRKVAKALGDDALDCTSWYRAMRMAKGLSLPSLSHEEMEEWLDSQAADFANRMTETFSTKLAHNPDLAARALSIYFGRKLPELLRSLRDYVDEEDSDDDDADGF